MLLLATPTQYLRSVLDKLKPHFDPERHLLVDVAKGIEVDSWLRISEMVESVLGENRYAVLSGPSHAEEVSRQVPTAVVVASRNPHDAELVQTTFFNDNFRVYTGDDVVGVELGGALKNVMAIAAGIIDGMRLGDNPKAALMTRGISEMGRLGELLGGQARTFSGLSGIGDLIVTCTSGHSRNRHVGEELGRGRKLPESLRSMGMVVAEGVTTARGAYALARRVGAELVRRFAAAGARVAIHCRNSRAEAEQLLTSLAQPDRHRIFCADLARPGEAERLFAAVGRVDVLVNNASLYRAGRLAAGSEAGDRLHFEVNFWSPLALMRAFAAQEELTDVDTPESLEQLRWLENGYRIKVGITHQETIGIDTPEDMARAIEFMEKRG